MQVPQSNIEIAIIILPASKTNDLGFFKNCKENVSQKREFIIRHFNNEKCF
jgi:hypothetical protein